MDDKGGSEATERIAEADLVPSGTNLLAAYSSFGELVDACQAFCEMVNGREHRATRRVPEVMLAEERMVMHPLPERAYTAAFGVTRTVASITPMIASRAKAGHSCRVHHG